MIEIALLKSTQIAEAKLVIYTTAHEIFHHEGTLEGSIGRYQSTWPLRDIDHFAQDYVENGGTFLVALDHGQVVGTGALHRLEDTVGEDTVGDDTVGEVKRLWLLKAYQGQGLGYRLMQHLLAVAREKGYQRVRLETSPVYQQQAVSFYQRLGFRIIPRYGDEPDDIGMELVLSSITA